MKDEKKSNSFTIAILLIIIVILLIDIVGTNYFNKKIEKAKTKEPITMEQLKEYAKSKEIEIHDSEEYIEYLSEDFQKAVKEGFATLNFNTGDLSIEFYKMKDENYAKYQYYKEIIEAHESNNTGEFEETYESGNNYLKYTFKSNGFYGVIMNIEDSFLYLNVKQENQSEVDKVLADLKL